MVYGHVTNYPKLQSGKTATNYVHRFRRSRMVGPRPLYVGPELGRPGGPVTLWLGARFYLPCPCSGKLSARTLLHLEDPAAPAEVAPGMGHKETQGSKANIRGSKIHDASPLPHSIGFSKSPAWPDSFSFPFKLILERERGREEKGERERKKHRFVVPLIHAFIGRVLFVP